ncbi:MAG: FAD-binding oxidoreductase [Armatimonadota bacterium]|nr:FAD-binding oxidoreductase [Armatimonadota bacterium]
MMPEDPRRKSFWQSTIEHAERVPLTGSVTADVAIIGAGYSGLSSAYYIRRADSGSRVAVLEAQTAGYGASGRNGGFSMTLFGVSLEMTHRLHGGARTREAMEYMVDAVEHLDGLVRTHGLQCDYVPSGFLRVATTPGYRRRLQHELEIAGRVGLAGVDWWDEARVQAAVHSETFLGGVWEPRCALIHPARLASAMARLAEAAGAVIYERSPVTSVERVASGVRLVTPRGTVNARKVVFATNAWSHLFPWVKRKQVPVWTHLIATEPLTPAQWASVGWQDGMGLEDARNLIHYFRPSPDGRILMGGGGVVVGYGSAMDHDSHPATFHHLEGFLKTLFPQLGAVRVTHRWGGPVSVTSDFVPAVGYVGDPCAVYNVGCIGHGVSLMPSNGRIIADLVLERKTPLTDLWFVNRRLLPWPGEPLRYVGGVGVRALLALQDRLYERRGLGAA